MRGRWPWSWFVIALSLTFLFGLLRITPFPTASADSDAVRWERLEKFLREESEKREKEYFSLVGMIQTMHQQFLLKKGCRRG